MKKITDLILISAFLGSSLFFTACDFVQETELLHTNSNDPQYSEGQFTIKITTEGNAAD